MSVSHIAVVQLPVSSLVRSKRLYGEALGLRLALEDARTAPGPGFALYEFGSGRASLQLQESIQGSGNAQGVVVAFELEPGTDIAGLLQRVGEAGGEVRFRETTTGEWLRIRIEDPDGNALELLVPL